MKEKKDSNNQTEQTGKSFISLRNDYAFTQTMKNPMVLRGFLAAVFGMGTEDIQEIKVKDRHLKKVSLEDKLGVLDVRAYVVEIGDIDIEIQIKEHRYWDERSIFYCSQMYIENVSKGTGYDQCKKVISITILGFNHCKDTSYFYSRFHLREDERNTLLSDVLEFQIIELGKLDCEVKEKDKNLHKWASLINAESEEQLMEIEKDPYIEEALKELEEFSKNPDLVEEYRRRDKALRDYVTFMESAKKEGLKQGEDRLSKLIQILSQNNETEKIIEMADNKQLREELLKKYNIE